MRQLIEWSQELQEPGEFLSTLRVDLAPVEVYAFTPKGRVLELPRGATPVDFAYTVHTEVGHQCVGAKVNGQMVSLRHEIVSGDVVEILTQKGHTPSRDWLSFTKSSHARSKIRHWINLQEREEAREMGQRLLEKEARQFGRSLKKIPEADLLKQASDYGLSKIEDLYAAVGFGKYSARQVLARVLGEPAKPPQTETEESKPTLAKTVKRMLGLGEAPLIVKGHDDLLVYRAKCCNPIPGDDIIGYITRGRAEPSLPDRKAHCCRVGRRRYRHVPRAAPYPRERPPGPPRGDHYGDQRRWLQHSHPRKPARPLERAHRSKPRDCRPPAARNHPHEYPQDLRCLRR
jgi:GTP pyrophosphokinase